MTTDIIDALAGVAPGSALDGLRRHRAQARDNAQASYEALFTTEDATGAGRTEMLAVATFVAAVHGASAAHDHYRGLLERTAGAEFADRVDQVASAVAVEGPYGRFPDTADLRSEDAPGPAFHVDADATATLGERLSAALEHAHLLVFRPRESSPEALAALVRAGWSTPEIVTLAQLVAFLSFQLRVVDGLAVLGESESSAGRRPA